MRSRRLPKATAVGVLGGLIGYLLFWPVPIDPIAWTPPPSPGFGGRYAPNQGLAGMEIRATGVGKGPESVALGPDGYLYSGLRDGRIIRFASGESDDVQVFANTHGSPGGLAFDSRGNLVVADAVKGLLSVAPDGGITVLVERLDGKHLLFLDGLVISRDGTIWFTEASQRWAEGEFGNRNYAYEFLENRPTGRLLSYDPRTATTRVRLVGLRFANGVAFGPNESFVLVNETLGYRTVRLWLRGPQAGTTDVFAGSYPALPDNITFNGRDRYWIAFFMARDATLDAIRGWPGLIKKVLLRLPEWLEPEPPAADGLVVGVDLNGDVVASLHDPTGAYCPGTSSLPR
jgi:sugar lactone lactonase YvrE